jgi:hypothetical protein
VVFSAALTTIPARQLADLHESRPKLHKIPDTKLISGQIQLPILEPAQA